jgi:hypothetical protein
MHNNDGSDTSIDFRPFSSLPSRSDGQFLADIILYRIEVAIRGDLWGRALMLGVAPHVQKLLVVRRD